MTKEYYSIVVDTLKKMYEEKKVPESKINKMYSNKVITLDEYNYILGKGGA